MALTITCFPDHHNPPLDLLFSVVLSLDNWLRADPANVAVVHCVGGKGRTGTVIAAYLLFIRAFDNPTEALAHFGRRRGGDSVTRAAQIRYVEYFHQLLEQKARPVPKSLLLRRVVLIGIPAWSRRRKGQKQDQKGARLVLKIFSARRSRKQLLYCTLQLGSLADFSVLSDECLIWALPSDFTIKGEVLLTFYHQKKSKKLVELFRYNFHTGFVEDLGGTILTKHDMDYKHDSVKKKLPEDFSVQLFMEAYSADKEEMEEDSKVAAVYNTVFELRTKLYSQRFEIEQSQQSQPQEDQQIDDKEE
ncbi:Tensin-3, variant 2 [Balamuthia mandrillaris]